MSCANQRSASTATVCVLPQSELEFLFAGVSIEANAIVAAGSVVTKDVAAATIVAGNPAQAIGSR